VNADQLSLVSGEEEAAPTSPLLPRPPCASGGVAAILIRFLDGSGRNGVKQSFLSPKSNTRLARARGKSIGKSNTD
jgi:hypothetical protein